MAGGFFGRLSPRGWAPRPEHSRELTALCPPLIWLHSDDRRRVRRLEALSELVLRDAVARSVLLTHPDGTGPLTDLQGRVALPLGPDDAGFAKALLARCAPAVFLSTSRQIPTGIIAALRGRGTRICLAENAVPRFVTGWRGLPGLSRQTLSHVDRVFVPRDEDRAGWWGVGLGKEALVTSGRLSAIPVAPACNEGERDLLADAFRNRTLWCAIHLPEREEEAVLAAHREALRDSHRLALILHPADPQRGAALKDALESRFNTALRSADDPVTPETQVYIADTEGERGLWYRLASACYVGGSLSGEGAQLNPMEAAALGCAVVHGRMFGQFAETFDLLRLTRATRMVQSADALGPAIGNALRPEQAADMAHRGWQVIAEAAEATEIVMAELRAGCATGGG